MSQKPYLEAVRILAAAAWSDGSIGEEETAAVRQMIDVGPLDADEKAAATSWLHTRPDVSTEVVARLSKPRREDIYKSAVRIAAADGRTVRTERGFLSNLEQLLGLDEAGAKAIRDAVKAETAKQAARYARLFRLPTHTLAGELTSLQPWSGKALLIVNVASECGFTPQYAGLETLQKTYGDRGLVVLGFPCNQFGAQEPGTADEIARFCSSSYGVTFPLMEKIEVKGEKADDIYRLLSEVADADGAAGEVQWNFEKFLVSADANTVQRFRSQTKPDDPTLIAAIEAALP